MNSNVDRSRAVRNSTAAWFFPTLLVSALALIGFVDARAQQPAAPAPPATVLPDIEVLVTPYLWLPWTAGTIRPSDSRLPSASSTMDPGKLINHLTWVPFMGQAEFRSGPFGVVVDYIHAPVKSGISTRNILFGGGTGNFGLDTGSAVFLYRALTRPNQNADVGVGFRASGLDGDIALNRGLLPPVSIANGLAWA